MIARMEYQEFDFMDSAEFDDIIHGVLPSPSPSPGPQVDGEASTVSTPRRQVHDLKKPAVPVACLRCRRRKVRCSGLPGPCVTCAKFGVPCIDPGKRRARSKSASGPSQWDARSPHYSAELEILQPQPRQGQLKIQTQGLWNEPLQSFHDDYESMPVSPACYSDVGPELDANWPQSASDAQPDYFAGLVRAQTYPTQESGLFAEQLQSPIPSIQITSHEGSVAGSPLLQPTFDIPSYVPQQDLSPLHAPLTTSMDYYSDFLSPTDQPPVVSRRTSVSFGSNTSQVEDWTQKTQTPVKRRHTTCSLTKPGLSDNTELIWMLKSPRTTNYLKQYMETIHPRFPFLDLTANDNQSQASFSPFANSFSSMQAYQRLLTAAIGAMLHHNSRDISARYVRHAMTLQKTEDLDLFGSVSGIHCALLLAIYLLHESRTEFDTEDEDTSHPHVNMWLWNCRIAAACIDLGLHEWPQGEDPLSANTPEQQERAMAVLCLNTFQSAWSLDKNISATSRRPTAFHAEDIDVHLLTWVMEREQTGSGSSLQQSNQIDVGQSFRGLVI